MKAGFATADITPQSASSNDVHDPLHVNAAVFESHGERVALVSVDAVALRTSTVNAAKEIAEKATGIPKESMLIAATCTHSGGPTFSGYFADDAEALLANASDPELIGRLISPGDSEYLAFLSRQIASAIGAADENRREAACGVGVGNESSVTFNRRFRMKNGFTWTHPGKGNPDIGEPAGPTDPDVGVLAAWSTEGKLLGCIVNFACYATTNPAPGQYSADWPYYLEQTIKAAMGDDVVVVFLIGASGDVTQADNLSLQPSEHGEKWSRRVGRKVGAEVLKVLSAATIEYQPGDLTPTKSATKVIDMPYRKLRAERLREAHEVIASGAEDYRRVFAANAILLDEMSKISPTLAVELQAVQIGPLVVVSSPGFVFCQFGLDTKSASKFPHTFVATFANGDIGYVPTDDAYGPAGGGYEQRNAKVGPGAGRQIQETWLELIERLEPGAAPATETYDPWPDDALPIGSAGARSPWNYGAVGPDDL